MKHIVLLIKVMHMGGAERVISELADYHAAHGWQATVILTHQSLKDANLSRLDPGIRVLSLEDELEGAGSHRASAGLLMLKGRIERKLGSLCGQAWSDRAAITKYHASNHDKVRWLKRYFKSNPRSSVVSFLYDSIFLTLLSARKTNKVIISDRGDPQQSVSSRTDMAFFRRMFPKADHMVFQSPDVREWYKVNTGVDGVVIFNPVKDNLPDPYQGIRQKRVVNFCRITPPKNLLLLIHAFERFAVDHPEYELMIYGDDDANEATYCESVRRAACESPAASRIHIYPARPDIHSAILDAAMFVSSSDFEGMSNSMLEAMAIGLPTICTDCPAGGARAVIIDHENGLLVPIKDEEALYRAMREVVEDVLLEKQLIKNGSRLRYDQSLQTIMKQWEALIND